MNIRDSSDTTDEGWASVHRTTAATDRGRGVIGGRGGFGSRGLRRIVNDGEPDEPGGIAFSFNNCGAHQ